MRTHLTREQIAERIAAMPLDPNRLTREQIRQRLEEMDALGLIKRPKKPKNALLE